MEIALEVDSIEPEELARRVFRAHVDIDPAYRDLSDDELDDFVKALPWLESK
jgi:hypothetical protein